MPALVSPVDNAASWSYAIVSITVPAGLRYAGLVVRGLRLTRTAPANVVAPALGMVRRVDLPGGEVCVELQVDPFPIRSVAAAFPWGLPTFYLIFPDASGISAADHQMAAGGEAIRASASVTVLMVAQDRITRDPALWAADITAAIEAGAGDPSAWQPFAAAVEAATNTGPAAPVLLLDHAGQPRTSGQVDIVFSRPTGPVVHRATLQPVDGGDLQRTVARMHAADPAAMPIANLWSTDASLALRPVRGAGQEVQLSTLEARLPGVNEIELTPATRHATFTNLFDWFAPQFAVPASPDAPRLQRYTRGNLVTPLVNGPEFFDDFFRRMNEARIPGGGVHLAGWAMFPETEFTKRRDGDPEDLALTLKDAAQRIGEAQGASRFLPARFIQLPPESEVTDQEIMAFQFLVSIVLIANSFGVSAVRTDSAGVVILLGLMFGNALFARILFESGGRFLEPNEDAVDVLNTPPNSICRFSPFPATIDDNSTVPQPVSGFPFDTLFEIVRHFGIYHQKFAVVRTPAGDVGYCGGIDVNPNRLDDIHHLARGPYHDVHAKVTGQAVRDLAISFEQRWQRDGEGTALAFELSAPDPDLRPGSDIVQVARTYFAPADPSRRLDFAPDGDRTIADDMLNGIRNAKEFIYIEDQYFNPPAEYNQALIESVSRVRKLIIVIPSLPDQPLGDVVRSQLMTDLRAADQAAGGGILQIGYPRRRYTIPDNDVRTSSGKCILREDLPQNPGIGPTVVLFPESRVPVPPFWLSVGGELMWVYDESTAPAPAGSRRLRVERGDRTRLFTDASGLRGPTPRLHLAGAPATVIDLAGIYVHAKMMIVDDVFLGIGSANLNRRGLFHDGEINIFTMPEALRATATNPVAALRRRLWAEMLDLPADMAGPLLDDPGAASELFRRSPLTGNRYVDSQAFPATLFLDATTGDALVSTLLLGFVFGVGAVDHVRLFDTVLDPSSRTENA